MSDGGDSANLPTTFISDLLELSEEEAVARLRAGGWWNTQFAASLAEWALNRAAIDVGQAGRALVFASLISTDNGDPPSLMAQIAYADARRAVHSGDLVSAESALLRAQEQWRSVDARGPYARTFLGLTQVLTMQGRYAEAETAAQGAIDALNLFVADDPAMRMLLSRAHRNRANLFGYLEQHAAARDAYLRAREELERFRASFPAEGGEELLELESEFGHLALNLASAYTFLDSPDEAETLLQEATSRFELAQDLVNRERAQANLGRLYLRLGEYAPALRAFDQATSDLIGDVAVDVSGDAVAELDALRQADELLLEHALAYLSLNLLPEAALALERCERLFRATGQPYELAQCRYTQGMLSLQRGDLTACQTALAEALELYNQLGNVFWRNRTQTALIRLAIAQGDRDSATNQIRTLLAAPEMTTPSGAVAWDLLGLVDVLLLRLQLFLDGGDVVEASAVADQVESLLGSSFLGGRTLFPHLVLRLYHARGRIATASGDDRLARTHFISAVELLDRQRATLPLEEVRTAYLDDKMAIFSDLVLNLLSSPLPSDDDVAAAFAVVERARSRALLERLLSSVEGIVEGESDEVAEQRAVLRRQLHWLYNQLLGESGNRRLDGQLSREVAQREAAIQQLEWRSAPILAQAEPVRLEELQQILAPDQQALVYYFAGNEVLAFIVDRTGAHVVRHLTTVEQVEHAQAELRFQLGRAEMGSDYVTRHYPRLMRGVQDALAALYQQLVAPLRELLISSRLLIIPYGLLHLIPFHSLWYGDGYWLEEVEISYVPSASIAFHKQRTAMDVPLQHFAGFAPYDERIPQAQAEIDMAATYFATARRYHREAATIAHVKDAAATTDVLHLATHGLYRPDNSFFSAIKLADGWMDVREIYRLTLSARLVVLSACESGVGEVRAGDEVVGLARGFLAAGTQNLIATLWNVHDHSAAQFMRCFYDHLQKMAPPLPEQERAMDGNLNCGMKTRSLPAAALRAAQLDALRNGAHPYYWAPFFAIG